MLTKRPDAPLRSLSKSTNCPGARQVYFRITSQTPGAGRLWFFKAITHTRVCRFEFFKISNSSGILWISVKPFVIPDFPLLLLAVVRLALFFVSFLLCLPMPPCYCPSLCGLYRITTDIESPCKVLLIILHLWLSKVYRSRKPMTMCHIACLFLPFPLCGRPLPGQTLSILQGPAQISNVKLATTLETETEYSILYSVLQRQIYLDI